MISNERGGREAFERWLNAFYDLVEDDAEIIALFREGERGAPRPRDRLVERGHGRPAEYTESHGGYAHMLAMHRGLGITPEMRLRFVTLLSQAADVAGLRMNRSSAPR